MGQSRQQSSSPAVQQSSNSPGLSTTDTATSKPMNQTANMQNLYGNSFMAEMEGGGKADTGHDHGHDHAHGDDHGKDLDDNHHGGVRAGAPRSKAAALKGHEDGRKKMDKIIKAGVAQDVDPLGGLNSRQNLYHNAAEWVDKGKADMVILAPTHDSEKRAHVPANKMAFFDPTKNYKTIGSTYDSTAATQAQVGVPAGIEVEFSNVLGTMSGDGATLTVVDPKSKSEGLLVETLIHEVQHDADQHKAGDTWATVPGSSPNATDKAMAGHYNGYQSEFRAYWMENPEGSGPDNFGSSTDTAVTNFNITAIDPGVDGTIRNADDVSKTVSTAFTNKRQQDIFNHMCGTAPSDNIWWDPALNGGSWVQSYAYIGHFYALDPEFKKMVDTYDQPRSGNLINSVRIQDLSEAVDAVDWTAVSKALKSLDSLDIVYLSNHDQAKPFWDQVSSKLGLLGTFVCKIVIDDGALAGPWQGDVYTVVSGDSLSRISDRMLGDTARWREIYNLNKKVVGSNPNKIDINMKLLLPPL
jgi:hypothetical protein